MAQIEVKNLTFWYPDAKKKSLKSINLKVEQGEFVVICGKSGCGKTTLLRNLKNTIAPHGKRTGEIQYEGESIFQMSHRTESEKIGFVFQQPAHQLVTDKVWHELAFGLENLGIKKDEIRLRIAEFADYFGFADKMYTDVEALSGGQKQLLNIASIMVMQPEMVLLDEPTAQLDPIAADHLLSTIYKINRDFGTTIIISEHRLNGLISMADKLLVMDEGEIIAEGTPREVAMKIRDKETFQLMPSATKLYAQFEENKTDCPLTVGEARRWLAKHDKKEEVYKVYDTDREKDINAGRVEKDEAIKCRDIWYRYERQSEDIVKGLSINVDKSEIFGIVGGNGAGKSTLMSILCGIAKPYRGKCLTKGRTSMLVQDVTCLFSKDSVEEELREGLKSLEEDRLHKVVEEMELGNLLEQHPYDLSGGEQQRLGLGKLMLRQPDIILLDEPTKGMDETFKKFFGKLLKEWKKKGKTVIIVSHDIEFLSKNADRCGMFFDGKLISVRGAREFFKGNRYYTTDVEKILRR